MSIRHTQGFYCKPGSGFFTYCPNVGCRRMLIFGQTCVCGVNSMTPYPKRGQAQYVPLWGSWVADSLPRSVCPTCQFEYPYGTERRCVCD